jgi:hypothetical protein
MVAIRAAKAKVRQHRLKGRRLNDLRIRVLAATPLPPFEIQSEVDPDNINFGNEQLRGVLEQTTATAS